MGVTHTYVSYTLNKLCNTRQKKKKMAEKTVILFFSLLNTLLFIDFRPFSEHSGIGSDEISNAKPRNKSRIII